MYYKFCVYAVYFVCETWFEIPICLVGLSCEFIGQFSIWIGCLGSCLPSFLQEGKSSKVMKLTR